MDLVPYREDFIFKSQKRKAQAQSTWNQKDIAGADFETKDGFPHIFTWSVWDGTDYVNRHFLFGGTHDDPEKLLETNGGKRHPAFDLEIFCNILKETGNFSQGGHGKRRQPQQMYFFNLSYDATAILKTLHADAIDHLILGDAGIIDTHTWNLEPQAQQISIPNPNFGKSKKGQRKDKRKKIKVWVLGDESNYELLPFNRYIQVSYLPKKHLCIEPLKYYTKGVKWGKIDCWDIRPFCGGGSLNRNAKKHLNESKLDFTEDEMSLMGSLSPEGVAFSVKNCQKVIEYAEVDANLTARLAWKIVHGFESNGVRMKRPYSPASVAERAALDRCDIPTMNEHMANRLDHVLSAWTAYQGGWFESVGSGYHPNVHAFDITSAYPHVMWWLPCIDRGVWLGTPEGDPMDEAWEYLNEKWTPYALSYFEAEVIFPEGLNIYPAAKKSDFAGCLMNPQTVYGWFTGDEIVEFEKWGADIGIERWSAFIPEDDNEDASDVENGVRYPYRPFIQHFYGNKLAQDMLKGTNEYDEEVRAINKLMINSIYGKTVQAIEKENVRITGKLWNPFYAAVITAGCRSRMAEMIRLNGQESILAVNTDGLIFKATEGLQMPENPMPVLFDGERVNLGDWDNDGSGALLLMMRGVYSIIKEELKGVVLKAKTTFRGAYSMFIDHRDDEGNLRSDIYGEDWLTFCTRYEEESEVVRNAEINPTMRPFSLGEAKVRSNYQLANVFRIVDLKITACGDSAKRRWETKPQTFGDLMETWWPSETWERLL